MAQKRIQCLVIYSLQCIEIFLFEQSPHRDEISLRLFYSQSLEKVARQKLSRDINQNSATYPIRKTPVANPLAYTFISVIMGVVFKQFLK